MPAGVVNLVLGGGEEVGDAIVDHPDVPLISFTGSTDTGIDVAVERRPPQQARLPGDGRQERGHRHGRRRPRPRHRRHPLERLRHLRPALHRRQPRRRPPRRPEGAGRTPRRPRRRHAPRRRPATRRPTSAPSSAPASSPDQRVRRDRPGRKARDSPPAAQIVRDGDLAKRPLPPADDLRRRRRAEHAHRPGRDLRPGHRR